MDGGIGTTQLYGAYVLGAQGDTRVYFTATQASASAKVKKALKAFLAIDGARDANF